MPVRAENNLETQVTALAEGDLDDRLIAATALASNPDDRVAPILQALIDGTLYVDKKRKRIVFAKRLEGKPGYQVQDVLVPEAQWEVGRRGAKRIAVNNNLRAEINTLLAARELFSTDVVVRRAAMNNMLGSDDPQQLQRLIEQAATETDAKALALISLAEVSMALRASEEAIVLAALDQASRIVHPNITAITLELAGNIDQTPAVRAAANSAMQRQQSRLQLYDFLQMLFFGLSLGSVLVLAAIGLSITFGVMGVINMAHGELLMIGAYCAFAVQQLLPGSPGLALLLALPVAFMVSGLTGILIERTVVQRLYTRPLETLLATFGISLILQQAARSIFSPLNRTVVSPEWLSGSIEITTGLSLTSNRLAIVVFSALMFAAVWLIFNRTRLGLEIRAVMQNREMASAMGIRTNRVNMLTFGLGSGIAGIAGVALSQITNVGPNLGQSYIIDSFMVVVFGGVGSLWGTLAGGLTIGIASKLLEPEVGAVTAKIMLLTFIILFIQSRPQGLFPPKGRSQ